MNTTQTIILYSGLGFFTVVTLVAGYLHAIPADTTLTLFSGLVGSFIGIHVPSPVVQTKPVVLPPQTLNRG